MSDMNVDALLDSTLDDLADLPEFKLFPAGAYNGTVEFAVKQMGNNPGIEMTFTNQGIVELSDPTTAEADLPVIGGTTSIGFLLNNEFGQGALKKVLESLHLGMSLPAGMSSREIMEASKGASVMAVFSVRKDKTDTTKQYQQLKSVTVL